MGMVMTASRPRRGFLSLLAAWLSDRARRSWPTTLTPRLTRSSLGPLSSDADGEMLITPDGVVRRASRGVRLLMPRRSDSIIGETVDFPPIPGFQGDVPILRLGTGRAEVASGGRKRVFKVNTFQPASAHVETSAATWQGGPAVKARFTASASRASV